jgi:hypothetical protein
MFDDIGIFFLIKIFSQMDIASDISPIFQLKSHHGTIWLLAASGLGLWLSVLSRNIPYFPWGAKELPRVFQPHSRISRSILAKSEDSNSIYSIITIFSISPVKRC